MRTVWLGAALAISTVFAADPSLAGTFTVLHAQNAGDYAVEGGYSSGLKVLDGELYIANEEGGAKGFGTLLQVDPATDNVTIIHTFTAKQDGAFPSGLVVGDSHVFGSTVTAGTPTGVGHGTLYKAIPSLDQVQTLLHVPQNYNHSLWQPAYVDDGVYDVGAKLLYAFNLTTKTATTAPLLNGQDYTASGGLVASGSLLYGVAFGDAAVGGLSCLYSVDSATQQQTIVHVFSGTGTDQAFNLQASNGTNLLYAILDQSQVVEFDTSADSLRILHTFPGNTASAFPSELITAPGGLYGTTPGHDGTGTIFEIKLLSGAKSDLYTFSMGPVTASPNLLTYANGVFYGTAISGKGNMQAETVFSFTP